MNYGRVSDQIYDRSVYKTITNFGYQNKEKINGAGLGADCAVFAPLDGKHIIHAQGHATGRDALLAARAVLDACNRIAAYGVDLQQAQLQISIQINMSQDLREAKLRNFLTEMSQRTCAMQIPVTDVQVQIVPGLQNAIATAFAVAVTENQLLLQGGAMPDQDVVMTKWMGLEGTAILAAAKKGELVKRYPLRLIEDAMRFENYLSVADEAAIAMKSGVSAMQVVREGGIFGGLWQLGEQNNVGLVVDLKKIAVKQETIEVCEFFDVNPYKMLSGGSLLMTTSQGASLVIALEEKGIPAVIIGRTAKNHDRLIRNNEEERFLEPAREDEIYKVTIP